MLSSFSTLVICFPSQASRRAAPAISQRSRSARSLLAIRFCGPFACDPLTIGASRPVVVVNDLGRERVEMRAAGRNDHVLGPYPQTLRGAFA